MCKMCWEHWQFTSVQRTQKLFLCAKISIDPNHTVSARTWAAPAPPRPARPRRSTSCPASPRPPHSQTPPSTRTCWSRQVGRAVNTGAHFTVCGSNLSSSRFVSELWLLSRARPSPLLTNGQWTLWTVRTGGTNARQLLVTLLCSVCAVLEIVCWWLTQIDWVDERCVAAGGNLAASRPATAPTPARTNHLPPTTLFTINSYHLWNDFYVLSVFSEYEKIVRIVGIWWIVVNMTQSTQFKHSTALMIFSSFTKYSKNKYAISYRLGSRIVVKYFFIFVKYFSRPKLGTYSGRKPTSRGRSSAKRRNSGSPELEAQVEASISLSLYIIHSICSGQ